MNRKVNWFIDMKHNSPLKKQKGGGTTKTCLPAAKIRSMSKAEREKLVRAKRSAGKKGKYRRSSKTNVRFRTTELVDFNDATDREITVYTDDGGDRKSVV